MPGPVLQPQALLRQEQRQKLALTQQMRQSLALLALPAAELDRAVRELAADNPLLEIREPAASRRLGGRGHASAADPLERAAAAPPTLEAELLAQLRLSGAPAPLRRAAAWLAGNLDESGWLALPLAEAAERLRLSAAEAEAALRLLQSLQPAGIGARDLRECLLLQLDREPEPAPGARELAARWLPQLAARRWEEIAAGTGLSRAQLEEARRALLRLDPRPGQRLAAGAAGRTQAVVPDALVRQGADGELLVELAAAWEPRLSLADIGSGPLAAVARGHEAYAYVESCRRAARALIGGLEQRRETLARVVRAVFEEQAAFLERGWPALRPLTLADVALRLGLHESTVSRAVSGKQVRTPLGTYPLKAFFSAALGRGGAAEEVSAAAAKQRLAELVAAECRERPLSDQQLAERLAELGIPLSRRTVAKYRAELRIPSSSSRRGD
ncbi:RNA polymerase sigma-54 factor RpoN [Paenibacillus pasadenensis]|uniref:RNA polymerase sigma-54 factor RpoN n=1 Tax=Paenibacillus pasadenensis TaxID=217090 RepID=A0A2N5NCX6_9BACL|nr:MULTISPECIES: RNA polymerase factor sigma-54 [Paenibacillus]PLT48194.1 RNA polymerase sigma-54 factor RpoN [Paenibacillus pasadenensis]QGG58296.1 RNA polymerase factor sigma-54 [Paenibacillus sp. B01]